MGTRDMEKEGGRMISIRIANSSADGTVFKFQLYHIRRTQRCSDPSDRFPVLLAIDLLSINRLAVYSLHGYL
jgi:hypothetical protein